MDYFTLFVGWLLGIGTLYGILKGMASHDAETKGTPPPKHLIDVLKEETAE